MYDRLVNWLGLEKPSDEQLVANVRRRGSLALRAAGMILHGLPLGLCLYVMLGLALRRVPGPHVLWLRHLLGVGGPELRGVRWFGAAAGVVLAIVLWALVRLPRRRERKLLLKLYDRLALQNAVPPDLGFAALEGAEPTRKWGWDFLYRGVRAMHALAGDDKAFVATVRRWARSRGKNWLIACPIALVAWLFTLSLVLLNRYDLSDGSISPARAAAAAVVGAATALTFSLPVGLIWWAIETLRHARVGQLIIYYADALAAQPARPGRAQP